MQLMLQIDIPPLPKPIGYKDSILLIGSCFTENMAERLQQRKFKFLCNPHGIMFNPLGVAHSLNSYSGQRLYEPEDLFYLNELYNSWDHHTRFSHIDATEALKGINKSQQQAAEVVRTANWVVITLGSAFHYFHKDLKKPVANNHRAPGQWFEKRLTGINVIIESLSESLEKIADLNPDIRFLFTISPVRHIRDGVVDNNRSKARLIEAVHEICRNFDNCHYFPAFEIVMDVLRDYRYYDLDFVHPNYLATGVVWEYFINTCMDAETRSLMKEVQEITTAYRHKPRFPQTNAHGNFLAAYAEKTHEFMKRHPHINLQEELDYFLRRPG